MILRGYKTYIGLLLIAIGEAFTVADGLPDNIGEFLKAFGFLLAVIGRYLANKA